MKSYQAIALREEFPDLPQSRESQERLIMQIYPAGTLRGRPLQECGDKQIYSVAERLYRQAGEQQSEFSHSLRVEECRREYEARLNEMAGNTTDDWQSISELEKKLGLD